MTLTDLEKLNDDKFKKIIRKEIRKMPIANEVEKIKIPFKEYYDLISLKKITTNKIVEKCEKCGMIFISKYFQEWIVDENCEYRGCPNCKNEYNKNTFTIGKASLGKKKVE